MKLKFCNKFWYVILDSFILSKGLKQLIVLFLWHRGACCVQAFYSMNPLYQLGNSTLLSFLQMRTSSVKLKRSCFQKKTSSRKQFCLKINEQLVNGETLRKQETPLLRPAVCPISTTGRNPPSRPAALQVLGWGQARRDGCWQKQEGPVNTSHLGFPPLCNSLSVPHCSVLVSLSQQNKLHILHLLLTPAFVMAIYWGSVWWRFAFAVKN